MDEDPEKVVSEVITQFGNTYSSILLEPPAVKYHGGLVPKYVDAIRTYRDSRISSILGLREWKNDSLSNIGFSDHTSRWTDIDLNSTMDAPFSSSPLGAGVVHSPISESVATFEDPTQYQRAWSNTPDLARPAGTRPQIRQDCPKLREESSDAPDSELPIQDEPPGNRGLARELKGRHLQMIVIAGSIGTGLLVATGGALEVGGPGPLIVSFAITGLMIYCTCQALAELAVLFPIPGSFNAYSSRFIDPAWGFAMSWNYAINWLFTLPLEIIGGTSTLAYWQGAERVGSAVWVTIFLIVVVSINLSGVKAFGETEFFFSLLKVVALAGFVIFGLVVDLGGGPDGQYIGARYWHNPGAFQSSYPSGFISSLLTAAFAFSGTELVGICAAESDKPQHSIPQATSKTFWVWRIAMLYILSLIIVSLLVPYDDMGFVNNGVPVSPFTIAIHNSGVQALSSIMNAVIFFAILSAGSSSVYGASRVLAALAATKQAPAFLAYVDCSGRPLNAILVASAFGLLGYLGVGGDGGSIVALDWLVAICGMATMFTWASICLCHIRFRRAWKIQGRSVDELLPQSRASILGSWVGLILNILVIIMQPVQAIWAGSVLPGSVRTEYWFQECMSLPIVMLTYGVYKFVKSTRIQRASTMDLISEIQEYSRDVRE